MEKALAMLEENRERMEKVAERLLQKETITSVDMEEICGPRKGRSPSGFSEIVRDVQKAEVKKEEKKEAEKEKEEAAKQETKEAKEEQPKTAESEENKAEKEKDENKEAA